VFSPLFYQSVKRKLNSIPYSLIVDNATFAASNYCALKVKFLEKEHNEFINEEITVVKNRIIALSTREESSTGSTMKDIIDTRLFSTEEIKKNFKGFTHDNGSSIVGINMGLATLLRNSGHEFYDLNDPCHVSWIKFNYKKFN